MSKTQKNEMISLGNKFKNDDFQKLFTLFYNYQEKPFLSLTDSKDFIGIIFEENKSNQFMAINYISSNYLKEIMKILQIMKSLKRRKRKIENLVFK